jgi:hypothetical protein
MAYNGKKKGGYDAGSLLVVSCLQTVTFQIQVEGPDNRDDVAKDWASSS